MTSRMWILLAVYGYGSIAVTGYKILRARRDWSRTEALAMAAFWPLAFATYWAFLLFVWFSTAKKR